MTTACGMAGVNSVSVSINGSGALIKRNVNKRGESNRQKRNVSASMAYKRINQQRNEISSSGGENNKASAAAYEK